MAGNKVSVEISLEEKAALKALTQLTKDIQKTEGSFKKLGGTGDKTMGVLGDVSSGVSSSFKSLVGGVTVANLASEAILGVANGLKEFVLGSVNAAIQQENAINKVRAALRRSGEDSEEALRQYQEFASGIQQNSTYGDEVILEQLAIAKSYGLTNERAMQLVQAATELSATFGTNLDSNIKNLGKSFSGLTGELGEALPIIKTLTAEQLKAGGAIDLVNSKFAGAARAELDTYQGSVKAMSNAYSDLQEQLGAFVTESDLVKGSNSFLKSLFEEVTEEIKEFRIEMARSDEGFVENQESVNQLSKEYADLTTKIEAAKAVLAKEADPNTGFFEALFLNTIKAKEEVRELTILQQRLYNQISQAQGQAASQPELAGATTSGESGGMSEADKKLVESRKQAHAQLIASEAEFQAYLNEQRLLQTQIDEENKAIELQKLMMYEQEKINARFLAEEQKAAMIADAETRQLSQAKLSADKELAIQKSKLDSKKKLEQLEIQTSKMINEQQLKDQQEFFNRASSLASSENKAMAAIGIAAGLTQIAIATPPAIASSYKFGAALGGPPLGAAFGAVAAAAQAQQAARLAGLKFEHGGIVPGGSMTGDNVQAYVNSGEMILNRQQQTELFNLANGQGGSNSRIESLLERLVIASENTSKDLVVDGRAIATVVRNQVQSGFRLS